MPDISDPHFVDALATERAIDAARVLWSSREARRAAGVAWSGMAGPALVPTSPADLKAAARARAAARNAWSLSARGRFVTALGEAQAAARRAHASGERARQAAARDFEAESEACAATIEDLRRAAHHLLRSARAAQAVLKGDQPPP